VINILGLIFDGVLAVLLIVTIGYCSRLSRRIRTMQDTRGELASTIMQFDQATGRAMATLGDLQATAKRITEALQLKIEKANFLADDLAFLIEKSTKLAAQLEQQAKFLKTDTKTEKAKPSTEAAPATSPKPKIASWQPSSAQTPELSTSIKSVASMEALLSRLASPVGTLPYTTSKSERQQSQQSPRTGAERELLEALKSGR